MNREDIIRMAQEAGFDPHDMSDDFTCNLIDIERFAKLVAAQKEAWSEPQFESAPPKKQWVELTLKEILINRHLIDWTSEWSYVEFAREIERVLKEKNHG